MSVILLKPELEETIYLCVSSCRPCTGYVQLRLILSKYPPKYCINSSHQLIVKTYPKAYRTLTRRSKLYDLLNSALSDLRQLKLLNYDVEIHNKVVYMLDEIEN